MKRLLILLLLVACGHPATTYQGIDSELEPYIEELNAMSKEYTGKSITVDIPVNFHPMDKQGRCRKLSRGGKESREILINPEFFDKADKGTILATLLHEIGHCIYNKPHDDREITLSGQAAPATVMNTSGVLGFHFLRDPEYYFKEFHQ